MMERSLKIAWVKRIIENCDASWKIVPEYALNQYGDLMFFIKCQYDIKLFDLQNLPEFYRTILSYWQSFKLVTNHEVSAEKQIIWNNRDILVDGKPIFYNSWANKGIICIKDLLAVTNHEVSAKQIIWNNRDILVDVKPIFYYSWANTGIVCIKDLLAVTNHEVSAKQIIWNNRDILVDGKPIFYNSWANKGIICIKDLLAEDLNFLSLTELKAKPNLKVPFTTFYG